MPMFTLLFMLCSPVLDHELL